MAGVAQAHPPQVLLAPSARRAITRRLTPDIHHSHPRVLFLAGVYGGYFSAAQGVILLGILGILMSGDIQGHNALKNILQTVVNIVAAVFFALSTSVDWRSAGLIALGSVLGALAGAAIGKRIPVRILRAFVVVFGVAMALLMGWQAVSS